MGERMHEVCVCVFACRDACVELDVKSCDLFSAALCVHTHTPSQLYGIPMTLCATCFVSYNTCYIHTHSRNLGRQTAFLPSAFMHTHSYTQFEEKKKNRRRPECEHGMIYIGSTNTARNR